MTFSAILWPMYNDLSVRIRKKRNVEIMVNKLGYLGTPHTSSIMLMHAVVLVDVTVSLLCRNEVSSNNLSLNIGKVIDKKT